MSLLLALPALLAMAPLARAGAMDALPSVRGEPWAGPYAVALADLDGDGLIELVLGLPWSDRGGHEAGQVALVPDPLDLPPLSALEDVAAARLVGEVPQGMVGYALAAGADLDGDGYEDLAVGAPGRSDREASGGLVVLVLGGPAVDGEARVDELESWNGLVHLRGGGDWDRLGMRLFTGPDLDQDGRDELLVAVPAPTPSGSLSWGWLGLLSPLEPGERERTLKVNYTGTSTGNAVVGLSRAWVDEQSASLAGRAALLLSDQTGDGRAELLLGVPGLRDTRVYNPEAAASGAAFLFSTVQAPADTRVPLLTTAEAIGRLSGDEPGDAFPWLLRELSDGHLLASAPEAADGSGRVYRVEALYPKGERAASTASALRLEGSLHGLFGHAIEEATGLGEQARFAVGAPGANAGQGAVQLFGEGEGQLRASEAALGGIDGCWEGGQAGHALTSRLVEGRRVLAMTAPWASVAAEQDGLVALLDEEHLFALQEDCTHTGPAEEEDADGDGWPAGQDCDEERAWVHPGATEVCGNGEDEDCDGEVDEDCGPPLAATAGGAVVGGCGGCASGGGPGLLALPLFGLLARRRRAGRTGLSALLLAGASALGAPARAAPLDAFAGAQARLWASDGEERLQGPVLSGPLGDDPATRLLVANPYGIQGAWSAGEVHLLDPAALRGDIWLARATATIYGASENVTLGEAVALLAEPDGGSTLFIGIDHTGLDQIEQGEVAVFRRADQYAGLVREAAADAILVGERAADSFGAGLAAGQDLDGDGQPDLAIAAPTLAWRLDYPIKPADCTDAEWVAPRRESGAVYLLSGAAAGAAQGSVAQREGCEPERFDGEALLVQGVVRAFDEDEATWLGWRLRSPGDLDGDGLADLLIGSLQADLSGAVHLFLGPFPGGTDRELADADGTLGHDQPEGFLGEGLAVSPERDALVLSSPWRDGGAGRIWAVDLPFAGWQEVREVARAELVGEPGSALGAALSWGPRILAGAPGQERVFVLDEELAVEAELAGAAGLGAGLSWVGDLIEPLDGQPEALLFAPFAERDAPRQGVGLLLSGAELLEGRLPSWGEDPGFDLDGDGWAEGEDCDDTDPARFPGAEERCDGRDDDCDGQIDEDPCAPCGCGAGPGGAPLLLLPLLVPVLRRRRALPAVLAGLAGPFILGPACAPAPLDLELRIVLPEGGKPDLEAMPARFEVEVEGAVERLGLRLDGQTLQVQEGDRLRASLEDLADGEHQLSAFGFHARRGEARRDLRLVVDGAAHDQTRPSAWIRAPGGSSVSAWREFDASLLAEDDHRLERLDLYLDDELLAGISGIDAPRFAADVVVPPLSAGTHVLRLEVRDQAGNLGRVERNLLATLQPVCALVSPTGTELSGVVEIEAELSVSEAPAQAMEARWTDGSGEVELGRLEAPAPDEHGYLRWRLAWDSAAQPAGEGTLTVAFLGEADAVLCEMTHEARLLGG